MEELVRLANAYDVNSMHKVQFYIEITLYIILSLQIPRSKKRHDMCTEPNYVCLHNIVLHVSCGKSVVCVHLSVSLCCKYVIHTGAM